MKKVFVLLLGFVFSMPSFAYDPSAELCPIEDQRAVAGMDFVLKLDSYLSTQLLGDVVFSLLDDSGEKTGLYIDNEARRIVGRPLRAKAYNLRLHAQGDYGSASEVSFRLNVLADPQKRPQLRQSEPLDNLVAGVKFSYNLGNYLINPSDDDQVNYVIDLSRPHPSWISIENNHLLSGTPQGEDAGKIKEVWIVAKSNVGGPSEPLQVKMTIQPNTDKQPVITPFELKVKAANPVYFDLRDKVTVEGHKTRDETLKLRISNITPQVNWLSIDEHDKTILIGNVPSEAVNKNYIVTLVAETESGGVSASQNIVVQVKEDPDMTPDFILGNIPFPKIYPGMSLTYDFVKENTVKPGYHTAPFEIRFKTGTEHPPWVELKDNKLIIKEVPSNESGIKSMCFIIHNEPGGDSKPIEVYLKIRGFIGPEPVKVRFSTRSC